MARGGVAAGAAGQVETEGEEGALDGVRLGLGEHPPSSSAHHPLPHLAWLRSISWELVSIASLNYHLNVPSPERSSPVMHTL